MSRKTRKLMWSMPLIAAVAVIGALALFLTQEPDGAAAQQTELPGMVQNLKVEPYTDGIPQEKLEVTWDPPAGGVPVTGYRIDLSLDGSRWLSYIVNQGTTNLSKVYPEGTDNLKAGQTRHFRVFALNEHGTGPGVSDSGSTATSNAPDRPTMLTASQGNAAVEITAFDLNGNGKIDTELVDNVNEIELGFNVGGTAELEADVDGVSETFTVTVPMQTAIKLMWTPPEDPDGAAVSRYKIEYSINGDNWYTLVENAPNRMDYFDTNLRAGTERQYRIYAKNSVGTSAVSDKALGKTAPGGVPDGVTEVVIGLSPASTDVHLKWTPPDDPDGAPVTHYRIQARLGTDPDPTDFKTVHTGTHIAAASEYNFGGRGLTQAGIAYPASIPPDDNGAANSLVEVDIRIAAINAVNAESDGGDDEQVVTWVNLVDVPVGHEDAPLRPAAPIVKIDRTQNEGRSGLNVTWDKATFIDDGNEPDPSDPVEADIAYVLVIDGMDRTDVEHTDALDDGGSEAKPGHDDDGLAAGMTRKYRVYAVNQHEDFTVIGADSVRSFPSTESERTTEQPQLPGPPGSFTANADGHTEIRLRWAIPAKSADDCAGIDDSDGQISGGTEDDGSECGASVLDGYKIEVSQNQTSWTTLAETHKTVTYLATMLLPDTEYYFRVSAVNPRGAGMSTAVRSAKTHPPGEPTPPGGLVAQADGYDTLKICWYEQDVLDPLIGEEARDEGLPILGYQISYVMDDGSEMIVVANTMSKDTQWMQSGLGGETTRKYRVRSITLGGVGTKYAEATATTAEGPPSSALTVPTGVTATSDTDGEVTVMWMGGDNADRYFIIALEQGSSPLVIGFARAESGASEATITGLNSDASHLVIVLALKGTGDDRELKYGTGTVTVQ